MAEHDESRPVFGGRRGRVGRPASASDMTSDGERPLLGEREEEKEVVEEEEEEDEEEKEEEEEEEEVTQGEEDDVATGSNQEV